ncbi:ExbD/TolR family protein [Teredinibacter waterburyi]|jgi:Biopolymer transport protein ExbD/TolR.|uniref:ExbD/TolR family protein n=1 Tax=Teredinibacter waterburyi TaxID=1500538 RepID=UPI00165EE740|nr:biopolymer transporter ExbD [Teredinibacter waterburyi]
MNFKFKYSGTDEAELDVTSFMNLMIVLVPVLLLSMTFTQVTVLDVKLPDLTGGAVSSDDSQSQLEVVVDPSGFKVIYPTDVVIKEIPRLVSASPSDSGEQPVNETDGDGSAGGYDYLMLSQVLQEVKRQLPEKRDAVVLAMPNTHYQDLISTMQAVKSYKTVVAASVVEIELFPEISLGDSAK